MAREYGTASPGDGIARGTGKWGAGLALVAVLTATLVSLQLFQMTSASTSKPALRDALDALVEGDAIIERNYDDLRTRAEAARPGETLELRDYPVSVPLTRDEALATSKEDLGPLLLDRAVERMYEDGTGVLRGDGVSDGAGRFTVGGAVGDFLGFLRSDVHGMLAVLTLVLAGISVLLVVLLAALCKGFGRLVAVGIAVCVASLPLLLGGLLLRLYASTAVDADGEYLRRELMDIAEQLAWLPIRNGIAFTLMGAAFLITGVVCARLTDGRPRDAI